MKTLVRLFSNFFLYKSFSLQSTVIKELQDLLENTIKEVETARVKLDNRDVRIKELEKIVESQKGQYNLRNKTNKTTVV